MKPSWYPTAPALAYQQREIIALIHFNMATYTQKQHGDATCSADNWDHVADPSQAGPARDAQTFAPTALDPRQWAKSMLLAGVRGTVLTAKHGCGFALWPTAARLPNGARYGYSTAFSSRLPEAKRDVLKLYVEAMRAAGLAVGFYYSLVDHSGNYYLHQMRNVTRSEFVRIEREQEQELWTRYGALDEIWFDGGYRADEQPWLRTMLAQMQPDAVIHGGNEGAGGRITESPVAGCGAESTPFRQAIWSTGEGTPSNHSGPGARDALKFAPKALDWTIQDGDAWFWNPNKPPISLSRMQEMYHYTVGNNGVLELSFSPDRSGLIPTAHAARYAEFGAWVRRCYSTPLAAAPPGAMQLTLPPNATFDRVVLQEDLLFGQRIWEYAIEVRLATSGAWGLFANGTSIGHKKIERGRVFETPSSGGALRVRVTQQRALPLHMKTVAVFAPCGEH